MHFLLDMGLPLTTAAAMRHLGHDAVHLRERQLHRMPDDQIIQLASAEKRVLVTFDLDFPHLLALQRLIQPSVILIRLERFTTESLNKRLESLVDRHAQELSAGCIIVIDEDRHRVRPLPIW